MNKLTMKIVLAGLIAGGSVALHAANPSLEITPTEFDFGWAPENAIISFDVKAKNIGGDALPLTEVQPSCGCTATNFTPADLSSNEIKTIAIAFNTRGFGGNAFHKTVRVRAGHPEKDYTVHLTGHVTDPNAMVVPEGMGLALFPPETEAKKKTIILKNKSAAPVSLAMIQEPASWATVSPSADTIPPNGRVDVAVQVDGTLADKRNTSVTFEVKGSSQTSHLTLAIATGPQEILKPRPPRPTPTVKPTATPSVPPKANKK